MTFQISSSLRKFCHTGIDDATTDVLTDLSKWNQWNVADPEFVGEFTEGSKAILKPATPDGKLSTVKIRLASVKTNRELAWSAGIPLLFQVYHSFTLTPEGKGCKVL